MIEHILAEPLTPTEEEIGAWSDEERAAVVAYCSAIYRLTGDEANVTVPSRPACLPALPLPGAPLQEPDETAAIAIYETWSGREGYVPWVPRGNSVMQDEARRLAREKGGAL